MNFFSNKNYLLCYNFNIKVDDYMEKQRQIKILSIISLVLAISAMTLGFAAFSTTLSISSSATVTPSSEDFKITIYGYKDADLEKIFSFQDSDLTDSYSSCLFGEATCTTASIDNSKHTISNLKANFENKAGAVAYFFVIKNEGKYDAYLDLSNMITESEGDRFLGNILNKKCTVGEGATDSLVSAACEGMTGFISILDKTTGDPIILSDDSYVIPAGSNEFLTLQFEYKGPFADGPFNVEFDDIQLTFSTTKPGE